MLPTSLKLTLLGTALVLGAAGVARADCEADMLQMEQAYKSPSLTPAGKAALDGAKPVAVSALKKDDDAGCHKAISEAMAKAGMPLK